MVKVPSFLFNRVNGCTLFVPFRIEMQSLTYSQITRFKYINLSNNHLPSASDFASLGDEKQLNSNS